MGLAHGAAIMRSIVLAVATFVLGLTAFTGSASANTTAAQCEAMLGDVEGAREALASLEQSLVDVDAERVELTHGIAALEKKIEKAKAKGHSTMGLRAELDGLTIELNLVDELRPELVRQIDGLRTDIDATERGYISCIETVIAG